MPQALRPSHFSQREAKIVMCWITEHARNVSTQRLAHAQMLLEESCGGEYVFKCRQAVNDCAVVADMIVDSSIVSRALRAAGSERETSMETMGTCIVDFMDVC